MEDLKVGNENEATVRRLIPQDSRLPVPRRDHSAAMIKDNRYLLVFGGRNDNHLEMQADDTSKFKAFNDLLLFDTVEKRWTCLGVYGFRPSPRWNCALAVNDQREQIYLFGGSSYEEGSCPSEVYCLDYNSSGVLNHLSQIR